jgi:hypothetical protein
MKSNWSTFSMPALLALAGLLPVSAFLPACVSAGHSGGSGGAGGTNLGGVGGDTTTGAGGRGTGGLTGAGGGSVASGVGGSSGTAGAGGGGFSAVCPTNAFFCSGFEDAALPATATYVSSNDNNDPTKGLVFDKTVFRAGSQSLKVLPLTAYAQREVSVPAAPTFWFRAYLQTDVAIGGPAGSMHNLFFEAMWSSGQQDKGVEIVEEDCELGVNINDSRYGSNGTTNQPGCPTVAPLGTTLAATTWHCIEGFFDGTQGDFKVFANGTQVIAQTGITGAKQNFSALRFGYREYHPHDRTVWYDDVVVAPQRVGCP